MIHPDFREVRFVAHVSGTHARDLALPVASRSQPRDGGSRSRPNRDVAPQPLDRENRLGGEEPQLTQGGSAQPLADPQNLALSAFSDSLSR